MFWGLFFAVLSAIELSGAEQKAALAIASLTDPAKLATLKGELAKVFAKELYEVKLLSEEGWKRVEVGTSPKVLTP